MLIKNEAARRAFLVFSLQCCSSPLNRLNIPEEQERIVRDLVSKGELPPEGFEVKFREAYPHCSILAQQMGKQAIDLEVVLEYFLSRHNPTLDSDFADGLTYKDGIDCKVYPGTILAIERGKALVKTPIGDLSCSREFARELGVGEMVAVHRGVIAMGISASLAEKIERSLEKPRQRLRSRA